MGTARNWRRFGSCTPEPPAIRTNRTGAALPQATFLNRQALHLHPDSARVVMRRFGPSPEPRGRGPTDKLCSQRRLNLLQFRIEARSPAAAYKAHGLRQGAFPEKEHEHDPS
ncbi:MAG: hypothetical protein C0458_07725 [Methylobacterium sp.]|nr:hypothetical protein [Methylobacterium sp.]